MSDNEKKEIKNEKKDRGNNNVSIIIDSLLTGMDAVLATKTVVGDATKVGDVIILPLVDVSFGIGAGASIGKNEKGSNKGGGGGGISGKMSPSAVLVIKDGQTKLVNIKNQDTMTKILDMVPEVIDKFTKKGVNVDEDEIINAAFPEDEE